MQPAALTPANGVPILSKNEAFYPGEDLWLLADLTHSLWAKKLNWYLNFQIETTPMHHFVIKPQLSAIMDKYSINEKKHPTRKNSPLLIASQDLVPNKWTLVVPYQNSEQWLNQIKNIIEEMKIKSVRVFSPEKLELSDLVTFFSEQTFRVSVVASLKSKG